MRRWLSRLAALFAAVLLFSCRSGSDIVVLYTNDVHSVVSESEFGFAELAAYKKKSLRKTPYVLTVDAGDAIQGNAIGVLSKGAAAISAMNAVGYDVATYGNHEFDYGIERLGSLVGQAAARYVCCNVSWDAPSAARPEFLSRTAPYALLDCGSRTVAFIGVTTPDTASLAPVPAGCGFAGGEHGALLYRAVQDAADACRAAGADYVLLLSHLGATDSVYSSYALAAATHGIDVIIDGHSHTVMKDELRRNSRGEPVHITSTGSHFKHFGCLVISPSGKYSFRLVSAFPQKDESVLVALSGIARDAEAALGRIVAQSDMELPFLADDGSRLAARQETVLGDVCADAFRFAGKADIAVLNGAGIRAGLPQGDISCGDMLSLFPFGNTLCVIRASGQQIADALEWSCRMLPSGTNGFLQVSGISFEVATQLPTPVIADAGGSFLRCEGERRVGAIRVLRDGAWEALALDGEYTIASNAFLLLSGGDGYAMFRGCEPLDAPPAADAELLAAYLRDALGGKLSGRYGGPEQRIVLR